MSEQIDNPLQYSTDPDQAMANAARILYQIEDEPSPEVVKRKMKLAESWVYLATSYHAIQYDRRQELKDV